MGRNCRKCGGGGTPLSPTYSINSTLKPVNGESAKVQFRSAVSFTLNGTAYYLMTSEVKTLSYDVIRAALAISNNLLLFLNPAEREDFKSKYPETKTWNL